MVAAATAVVLSEDFLGWALHGQVEALALRLAGGDDLAAVAGGAGLGTAAAFF